MIVVVTVSTPVVKSDRKKGITMLQYIGLFPQDIILQLLVLQQTMKSHITLQ